MKKLILSAAILLGSLSTFGAINPVQNSFVKVITLADEYTEIKIEEVPAAVTDALKKSFPDAKLTKAYINEKKQYKLDVEVGEKVGTLYAEATGKWIK